MELRQYLSLARKWWWLIVLVVALAAGSSYAYSIRIPPTYRAETTVLVGQQQTATNITPSDLYVSNNLAQAYALLITQPAILQATAEAVNWQDSWQSLYFRVAATAAGSQLIKITATATDPTQAKIIADELARQLILQSPLSQQQKQAEEQREFVSKQQAILRGQIETAQARLVELNNQATLENDPDKLKELNERISALQSKVDNWQKNYAELSKLLTAGADKILTCAALRSTNSLACPIVWGLTSLFLDNAPKVEQVLQSSGIPGLRVLTSGQIPPNPAEILDSKRMGEILDVLRAESDIVIFDSPPALAVADASILGSRCSDRQSESPRGML